MATEAVAENAYREPVALRRCEEEPCPPGQIGRVVAPRAAARVALRDCDGRAAVRRRDFLITIPAGMTAFSAPRVLLAPKATSITFVPHADLASFDPVPMRSRKSDNPL